MSLLNRTAQDPVFVYDEVKQLAVHFTLSSRQTSALKVDRMLQDRDTRISELLNTIADKDAKLERYQHENAQVRGLVGNLRRAIATMLEAGKGLQAVYELPIPQPPRKDPDVEVRR